jgi:nucleoside-diphosphate-sugar epimerase
MSTVLVTGGSGFIGSYCILQLLATGHQIRTTIRNLKREGDVRAMLTNEEAVVATAESLVRLGLLKGMLKKTA